MSSSDVATQDLLDELGPAAGRCLISVAPLSSTGQGARNPRLRRCVQYAAGRNHAAQLLARIGASDMSVTSAADGSPCWPAGFVGSISHTDQLIGVAVASREQVRSVGIDLETVIEGSIADEVESLCLNQAERDLVSGTSMDRARFTTVCFSAKEALYKCLYPLVRRVFDFNDVRVVELDERTRTLRIQLFSDLGGEFVSGLQVPGSYRSGGRHIFTIFELAADRSNADKESEMPGAEFVVVKNREQQYAIWPADVPVPKGWTVERPRGSKEEGLQYVAGVWTDTTPRTVADFGRLHR